MRQALIAARKRTLAQAAQWSTALGPDMRVPCDPGLNLPLWELGHIGWFQEYWIGRNRQRSLGVACDPGAARLPSALPHADALYDSSHVPHRSRWDLALPDADATQAFLRSTLAQTLDLLDSLPDRATHSDLYFFRLVALHEEMHAEAGAYMARGQGLPVVSTAPAPAHQHQHGMISIPAQSFMQGHAGLGFAFDNELGAHEVAIKPYEIDASPVTWSRFQQFIEAGGYDEQRWWNEEGWQWKQASRRTSPARDLMAPSSTAVHLSAYEAEAWCRWAGRRLPTESEWECAAITAPGFNWGSAWEWTATCFEPYAGFVAHPYRDYSQPWFGTRRVLKGACDATARTLAHPRYRNFFEPGRSDIFAGFRSCSA